MVIQVQIVRVISSCMILCLIPPRVFALSKCKSQVITTEIELIDTSLVNEYTPFLQLGKGLVSCGWHEVTIFSHNITRHLLPSTFLSFLYERSIPFTHHVINDNEFDQVFRNEYVKNKKTNFILFSDSIDILMETQRLFYKHSKGEFALLPQRSNWLLLSEREVLISNQTTQKLVFDNVAFVGIVKGGMMDLQTLLWKHQRRRKWEPVSHGSLGAHCSIFPNKANGLNGRTLTWVVGKAFNGAYLSNNSLGQPEYAGFYVDVALELQNRLNFTSAYDPPPSKNRLEYSQNEVEMLLRNHSVHLGLLYFSKDAAVQLNLTATYPIRFDRIVAAYVYKESSGGATIPFFGQYQNVLKWTAIVFFCVLSFYHTISYISLWIMKETDKIPDNQQTLDGDSKSKGNTLNAIKMGHYSITTILLNLNKCKDHGNLSGMHTFNARPTNVKNSFGISIIRGVIHIYQRIPEFHAFAFLGSIFGQSTMIRPKQVSLRIFVFFWCLCIVLFSSLLTGTLTASFVTPGIGPPFTKVSQALKSDDVECGSFHVTEIHDRANSWRIDGKKWTGQLHRFSITFSITANEFRQFMEQPTNRNKVFIYYRSLLLYFKEESKFEDLYITEDTYQQAPLGFVAPIDSELEHLISSALVQFHESGYFDKLNRKYLKSDIYIGSRLSNEKTKDSHTGVSYFTSIFFAMGVCLGFAVLILGIEFVANYAAAKC